MVDLVFNNSTSQKKFGNKFFQSVLGAAAEDLKLKGNIEVSVNLVSSTKIKSLNNKYRNKNKTTDVLSFPLEDNSLKRYGIMPLGDIFICPEFIEKQIKKTRLADGQAGKGLRESMARLSVHGFLHLLGYDHEKSEKDARAMFLKEEKILKTLNF